MNQSERRQYLIRSLCDERAQYRRMEIPSGKKEQDDLLRALMNVREPEKISEEILKIQDAYLQEEQSKRVLTDVSGLTPVSLDPRMVLWQGDITTLKVDAIVNAANSGMCGCFYPLHGCIDNIIHSRSGIQLRLYCADMMRKQGHEEATGQAKITPAFNLPCKYVLHTVGPIIRGAVTERDCELLESCYRSCLTLAAESGVESIAFCCISTGEFHFPNEKAAEIAVQTVKNFLATETRIKKVVFNVFKDMDKEIYRKLLGADRAD